MLFPYFYLSFGVMVAQINLLDRSLVPRTIQIPISSTTATRGG